ncbi:MAG: sulfite exporter TauE/SafE family protein [Candidatus Goldbacteria bacterium]|nr:sulfite exporter TauE/SafE family protein [Candidatus Goldiibacteriota bacterium]
MTFVLFIVFFLISILFSMLGLGGGILFVPILLQCGLSYYQSAATSLSVMLVLSLTATFIYHSNNFVDWKIVFLLVPFSLIGAFFAGANSNLIPEKVLMILFPCLMLTSAFFTLKPPRHSNKEQNKGPGFIKSTVMNQKYYINLWLGIPLIFLAGIFSSLLGVGGGFINVPLMTIIFGVPTKVAVATSSAMIIITSLSGFMGHSYAGHINIKLSLILSLAAFSGALIGSRISIKANKRFLDIAFAVILILMSAWMIIKLIFNF